MRVMRSPTQARNGNGHESERERVARVVEECTTTISREVEGLKAMVDEFTRFARLPHARLEPADLNEVVRQAVSLYHERLEGVRMDVLLAPTLPGALLDGEQIRRVFVNLIDNSVESLADGRRRPAHHGRHRARPRARPAHRRSRRHGPRHRAPGHRAALPAILLDSWARDGARARHRPPHHDRARRSHPRRVEPPEGCAHDYRIAHRRRRESEGAGVTPKFVVYE